MKLAFVADFHGNYTATQALEKALAKQRFDKLICLGDMVGKGPNSPKTMDWAMANCDIVIGGNWDYGIGHQRFPKDEYYWHQLGKERLEILRKLPKEYLFHYRGNHLRCIHGRPIMEDLLSSTAESEQFEALLEHKNRRFNVLVYGDMHRQLLRTINGAHIVNCGSVGNAIGVGRVCYAIIQFFDDGGYAVQLHSVPYSKQRAINEALKHPNLPYLQEYLTEIETAKYVKRGMPTL